MNPNEKLQKFLEENGFQLQINVIVVSPLGDPIRPGNFIPQGWALQPQVTVISNGKTNPGNGVPDVLVDAGNVVG